MPNKLIIDVNGQENQPGFTSARAKLMCGLEPGAPGRKKLGDATILWKT
jgi:hypothetical protein